MKKNTLTPKQESFCHEYLIDLNGTQAAIRAGYSVDSAAVEASRLLINAKVADLIAELKQERQEKTQITAEWVLKEAEYCYNALKNKRSHKDALSALKLIGEHTSIKAFDKDLNINHQGKIEFTLSNADEEILNRIINNDNK